MPRMSPELLLSSHSYLNPLSDRELDLRGYQIPAIENLGVTKDSLDSIDLTDNSIRSLINFPKMTRLKHLYLSNNPLTFISPKLPQALPNLNSPKCNPVCKMKLYRDWCIYNCPKVRVLDFRRVKDKFDSDRSSTIDCGIYGREPTEDSTMISTNTRSNQKIEPGQSGKTLTAEERERIKRSIEDATSVEEVRRLKRMLEQGFIPRDDRKVSTTTTTTAPVEEKNGST
ncbi:hypothetical protein PSTT_05052 [Puccinia striiformis]|uniref:U2 small nuclear ribonucleoprotein A' n=1 Tax=Puccinia striiformis TaxID=27350 RepID=A0A2S4VQI5_9BASI|nr:hypothetical protein PSTT_05052 [Puccinia striiformis]